jgi:hypothetical protein
MAHDQEHDHDNPDLKKVIEKVNEHVDTRMTYLRLLISEKVAIVMAKMTTVTIVLGLFLLFFLFTSVAAALWIGKRFDDYSIGFGAVSLFYLLLAVIYLLLRKSVFERKIEDMVADALYPEEEEHEDD